MGQSILFDKRELYLCERVYCFEVLNGDDFRMNDEMQMLSSPNVDKGKFIIEIKNCFGIKDSQIIWLSPEEIPRKKGRCCKCKEIKNFEIYTIKHYGDRKVCERCLIFKSFSWDFFNSYFDKKRREEMFREMREQEK